MRAQRRRQRRAQMVRRGVAVAPTLMTLGNLLCGFAAVFIASRASNEGFPNNWSQSTVAVLFIFLGMVFDGLDGRVARLTRSESELGEQLDSMADLVTFGVAPAFVVIQLVRVGSPFIGKADYLFGRAALIVAGIYVACAALRLARFNIETAEDDDPRHDYFKGMPTPGAAGTVASLVLLHEHFLARSMSPSLGEPENLAVRVAAVAMVVIAGLMAMAMVSKLKYPHVLNRYLRRRADLRTFVVIVVLAGFLMVHPQGSLAALMTAYALWPVAAWGWGKWRAKPQA